MSADNVTGSSDRFAQSLLPSIADVVDVARSKIEKIDALEDPVNGQMPTTWLLLLLLLLLLLFSCCNTIRAGRR